MNQLMARIHARILWQEEDGQATTEIRFGSKQGKVDVAITVLDGVSDRKLIS